MGLTQLSKELAWPSPDSIMDPPGPGPSTHLALARQKIQNAASTLQGGAPTKLGLICADPRSRATEAPLAIVCTFENQAATDTLAELHRLAWNFSTAPLLLTVDSKEVRAFTCSEPPSNDATQKLKPEIREARYVLGESRSDRDVAYRAEQTPLHWLEIASGSFVREHQNRFLKRNRADSLLLDNLRLLRTRLHDDGLSYEVVHDLLARTIFVQFLFDRRDAKGFTALSEEQLAKLHEQQVLSRRYESFSALLLDHTDTYKLFQFLDKKFNGDLFPSMGWGESGLQRENEIVQSKHLDVLSEFISGDLSFRSGQRSLWPMYSFDSVPLEFISSIYESFVQHDGTAIYTPPHLVDFVLDGVLPWDDTNWDIKVLDPSCGSGIFLVKTLRRLIHRWKLANGGPDKRIPVNHLRRILERNLYGVDIDSHAIRVAAFSLYLAMCDEIDPKHLWSNVKFPSLRGNQLIVSDFFDYPTSKFSENSLDGLYDVIIGNPPWGTKTITKAAADWAKTNGWPVSNRDIGPIFLAKSATLCKPGGVVTLMQPTGTLLTNTTKPACEFRKRLFGTLGVTEVVNLSAMRFGLFRNAVGPCSLVTINESTAGESITYVCPKPTNEEGIDSYRVLIDQYDINEIRRDEALSRTDYWTVLFWGTRRDLALIRKLERWPSFLEHETKGTITRRLGIVRGRRQTKQQESILGQPILEGSDFPPDCFLLLSPDKLAQNEDVTTHYRDSTDFTAFEPKQMLIRSSWKVRDSRFRAALVDSEDTGVLCSNGFITVHANAEDERLLESACMMMNSRLAVYYQLGNSGRFANYRPVPEVNSLLATPIPAIRGFEEASSLDEVDEYVNSAANLNTNEQALIDHALDIVLPGLKTQSKSLTRTISSNVRSNDLKEYCKWFMRTLRTGTGNRILSAMVFDVLEGEGSLPVRLVAFALRDGGREREKVTTRRVTARELRTRITKIYTSLDDSSFSGEVCPRVVRVFGFGESAENANDHVPTVFIVKNNQMRYWTRAMAMRDGDDVSGKLLEYGLSSDIN